MITQVDSSFPCKLSSVCVSVNAALVTYIAGLFVYLKVFLYTTVLCYKKEEVWMVDDAISIIFICIMLALSKPTMNPRTVVAFSFGALKVSECLTYLASKYASYQTCKWSSYTYPSNTMENARSYCEWLNLGIQSANLQKERIERHEVNLDCTLMMEMGYFHHCFIFEAIVVVIMVLLLMCKGVSISRNISHQEIDDLIMK